MMGNVAKKLGDMWKKCKIKINMLQWQIKIKI